MTQPNTSYKPINILFDSWSSQVLFQQAAPVYPSGLGPGDYPAPTGQRLNTILGAIKSFGNSTAAWNSYFLSPPIVEDTFTNFNGENIPIDVYVSLTRYIGAKPSQTSAWAYQGFNWDDYTSPTPNTELAFVQEFVNNGGGLLMMTDHGPPANNPSDDWTKNDFVLAAIFDIIIQNTQQQGNFVSNAPEYMAMSVNSNSFSPSDPANYLANQVSGIAAHDSCTIVPPQNFTPLAVFPSDAYCHDPSGKAIKMPSNLFSALVPFGQGNVIIVGNSGMVGDYGSPAPAPGLITRENNLMFFLNCIGFLGGLTCMPLPGKGPAGPCINQ